jgi:hypothetical protein
LQSLGSEPHRLRIIKGFGSAGTRKSGAKAARAASLWAALPGLRALARPRRGLLAMSLVLILISRAAGLALPGSTKFLIAGVIVNRRTHLLLPLIGAVVLATAVHSGGRFLSAFGAGLRPRTRRIFCQPCLDWSERRYHLNGLVGARILDRLLELGWLKCVSGSRALQLTSCERVGLSELYQIEINNEGVPTGRLCDPRRLTA